MKSELKTYKPSRFPPARIIRNLYNWVIHWAKTPYAKPALFGIAFAESSVFPIPPDVLLIAMGVAQPKKALRFGTICLVGSILGALIGYAIGMGLWSIVGHYFFTYVPGFTPALFDKVTTWYHEHSWIIIFAAAFTPIPYKIFTVAAGVANIAIIPFIFASIVGRGLRFYLVSGSLYIFGAKIEILIERYFDWLALAFTALLIGGFLVFKVLLV